jgi:hypothetical protein
MPEAQRALLRGPFHVDAHVHLHDCFQLQTFLDAAAAHARMESVRARVAPAGVLLFAESSGAHRFRDLRDRFEELGVAGWECRRTQERESVILVRDQGELLIAVAGRQIATAQQLEVLALCGDVEIGDGMPLAATIRQVQAAGALPVIPWGFGKWWFRRQRLVRAAVENAAQPGLFLGDNGGRPQWSRRPALFRLAEKRGIFALPGSDPLPFASEMGKVGRYGFVLDADLDAERPAAAIRRWLLGTARPPQTYGRREAALHFARVQLAMQVRGALSARRAAMTTPVQP